MQIILFSSDPNITLKIERILASILGKDEIIVFKNLKTASTILSKYLIEESKHIDLIIIVDQQSTMYFSPEVIYPPLKSNHTKRIIQFINNNCEETYSDSNLKLGSIPIIKICDSKEDISILEHNHNFFSFCTDSQMYIRLMPLILELIKKFRNGILLDLKDLELTKDSVFQPIKINYALYRKDTATRILSKVFVERQKRLNYYWFELSIDEIEYSINKFMDEITKARKYSRKNEKRIHRFLQENPNFLLRETYANFFYEKQLYYPDSKSYIEPDFILNPNKQIFISKTEIFEVKLPIEGIIKKSKLHQNTYSSFWNHLAQIKDYQDYFKMKEVQDEILNKLGYLPQELKYVLLVGSKEQKYENLEILKTRARQFNFEDINILTYEELLDYQIRFAQREKIIAK